MAFKFGLWEFGKKRTQSCAQANAPEFNTIDAKDANAKSKARQFELQKQRRNRIMSRIQDQIIYYGGLSLLFNYNSIDLPTAEDILWLRSLGYVVKDELRPLYEVKGDQVVESGQHQNVLTVSWE